MRFHIYLMIKSDVDGITRSSVTESGHGWVHQAAKLGADMDG